MTQKDILLILEQDRQRLAMSLEKYCKYIGVPFGTYTSWIYGIKNPRIIQLIEALDAAGYEITIRRKADDAARDG